MLVTINIKSRIKLSAALSEPVSLTLGILQGAN